MPKLFDISNWSEQPWWNTGGTRNKKVYLGPENKVYYFKQSLKKENKDYKFEFWSEIIASEIGKLCGFEMLEYHLAIRGDEAGCISKSMHDPDKEELVEGGKYLQAFDSTFDQEDRSKRHQYNFELITASLTFFNLQKYFASLVEVIVFDTLIGNSDRHQENWALITTHSTFSKSISELEYRLEHGEFKDAPKLVKKFLEKIYLVKGKLRPDIKKLKLIAPKETRFAPIYDSGCSFGRELEAKRVEEMLEKPELIENYLSKGLSEIHWGDRKIDHFSLLEHLLKEETFKDLVKATISRLVIKFDQEAISELIAKVDVELPESCVSVRIPDSRKELIYKLVVSRFNRLKALI